MAWAAGLFDAEGCFTYTESGLYASVAMTQTIREPLDRFREAVGAGTVMGPYDTRRPTRPSKQAQYQFHAYGVSRVRQIAELLWPHLGSIKRCQALRVLARAAEDHPIAAPTPEPNPPNGSPYQPTVRDHLAWAAGFLEGDGSLIYANSTRTMFVSFTQLDREVPDRSAAQWASGRSTVPIVIGRGRRCQSNPSTSCECTALRRCKRSLRCSGSSWMLPNGYRPKECSVRGHGDVIVGIR